MTLPNLKLTEIPDVRLAGLNAPPKVVRSPLDKSEDLPAKVSVSGSHVQSLVEALEKVETLFADARQLAGLALEQQGDYKRRVDQAEAHKAHLEQEVMRLRAQVDAMEGRIPRWVRRLCGV